MRAQATSNALLNRRSLARKTESLKKSGSKESLFLFGSAFRAGTKSETRASTFFVGYTEIGDERHQIYVEGSGIVRHCWHALNVWSSFLSAQRQNPSQNTGRPNNFAVPKVEEYPPGNGSGRVDFR